MRTPSRRVCSASIAAFLTAAGFSAHHLHGQTPTGWIGTGADTNWSTTGNWDNGAPGGIVRDLFFGNGYVTAGGTGSLTANNDIAGYNGYRITFEDSALAVDPAFTVTGLGFTLFDFGGSFPRIENQSTSLQTFNLTAGQTITLNGGTGNKAEINPVNGDLLFTANTGIALAGDTQLQVWGANGKTVTINGVISGTGTGGIAVNQASTLVLSGANTFTGGVSISAGGTVTVSSNANLGDASNFVALDGGTLNATAALSMSRAVSLSSTGTVTLATGTSVWSGQINGAGGFTKNGGGTLQLAGTVANTFGGTVNVNQGTLSLKDTGGNAIGAGGVVVTSNSTAGFGAAILSLAGNEQIDNNATVSLSASGGLRAGFDLNGFTETIGGATITSVTNGSATIVLGATGRLILNGDLTFNNDRNATGNTAREVLITGTGSYATTGVGGFLDLGGQPRTITVNSNNTQANNDATIEAVIENGSLIKAGPRVLRLGAVNTYSGPTSITNGTLRALVAGAIPAGNISVAATSVGTTATLDLNNTSLTPASLTLGGGSGANTVSTGTGTLTLANDIVYDATNNPQTSTISGNLNLGGPRTFDIADSTGTTSELVISAVVSGAGTGITKKGNGVLALSGANTFTGPIVVNGGALALRAANSGTGDILLDGGTLQFDTALADSTAFNNILGAASNAIVVGPGGGTIAVNFAAAADRTLTGRTVAVNGPLTIDVSRAEAVTANQLRFAQGTTTSIFTGSGTITKNGDGRLTTASPGTVSPNFSGAWIFNAGTVEASGASLGDGSATNTVTVNGLTGGATQLANFGVSGNTTQNITLNGGAISSNGTGRVMSGTLNVIAPSFVFLSDFWRDTGVSNILTQAGKFTGSGDVTVKVNRAGYDLNSGSFVLQNTANDASGNITIEKNLNLENRSSTNVGKTIGTMSVTLAGGHLNLRDNGAGSDGTLAYGNNIAVVDTVGGGDLAGISAITADRSTGLNTGNTFQFGTLTIGTQQLDVTASNLYRIQFNGLSTFTGSPTFNVTAGTLTLAGGVSAAGQSFTKTGPGVLRILGSADYTSFTLAGGVLEVPNAPVGAGRDIAIPVGVGFSAGYAATQANLIDRITLDSAGVVALGADSTFNPDFTGFTAGLRLGGTGNATLTGTITPADGTVRLGGGGGTLILGSVNAVGGTANLDVNTNGTSAGTVALAAANNYSGTTTVGGGMILRIGSNASLGTGTTPIVLDNGTLQLANGGDFTAFGSRVITAGAGGGALDTDGNNLSYGLAITGTGLFTKAGAGTLTLTNTAGTFTGKTNVRGGTLAISADSNLGAVPGAVTADQLQFSGGTLQVNATYTQPANRGITLGAGGGSIEVTGSNILSLAGGISGANPLTKEGTGTLSLTVDTAFTTTVTVNGGVLELGSAVGLDAAPTINNGATLRTLGGTNAIADGLTVTVNAGGTYDFRSGDTIARLVGDGTVTKGNTGAATLSLNSATAATFGGTIQNGSGTIAITKGGANTFTLTGQNTYTGATQINTGRIAVEGAAGALGNTAITVGDNNGGDESMTFGQATDVWTTGALNRIGDTGTLTLNGRVPVTYTGPAAGSSGFVETMGALTGSNSFNTLTLAAGSGAEVQLSPSSLVRANAGTMLVRADGLGATGAGSARLVAGTVATVGGGGAAGTTTQSIVPWIVGDASASGVGSTFVTNDAATGLRPLTNAEYDATIAGTAANRNVSVSGGETVSASGGINALRVTGGTTTLGASTRTYVKSGAVLFTDAGGIAGSGVLDFGLSDGIITVADGTQTTANLDASLEGAGGLTYSSAGLFTNVLRLGGDNNVIGNLTINSGTVQLGSSTALNPNYPMTVIPRVGSVFQLNGNDVTIRNLQSAGGSGTFQNGAVTPATLTTYLTAGQTLNTVLSNGSTGALNLVVAGNGFAMTLNQDASATGTAEVRSGSLVLNGTTGTINDMTAVTIQGGATLQLTNTNTANNTNRISNTASLTMNGGTLDFDNNAGAVAFAETIADLTLGAGANAITVDKGASATNSSVLTFNSLTRNTGAVLNLASQSNGTATFDLGATGNSRLVFTTAPILDDGIIGGWATIDSTASGATRDFVKYVADADAVTAGNQPSVTALVAADYTTTLASGANPAQNVKINASPAALTGSTQINSLNLAQTSATSVDIGAANTLRIESGGIIVSGLFSSTVLNNGTLTAGNGAAAGGDLVVHVSPQTATNTAVPWVNASDTITLGNIVNGTPVVFTTAPGGLTAGATYYVVNSTATNFQVSLTPGGTAIALTNDGTTGAFGRTYTSTINSVIADNGANPVNVVKAGAGILALSGTNTYTGKTYIDGGTVRITSDANLGGGIGSFTPDKIVLSNGGVLDVTANMTLDANRGITLNGGNNIISLASGTAGNGKTLTYNGAITSTGLGEGSIQFKSNAAPVSGIDPGKIAANLSSLNITGAFRVDTGAVTLSGTSNTIGRSLQVGMDGTGSFAYTGAGSSLTVGKGINDTIDVGFNTSNVLGTVGALNLSGLGQFTANVDQIRIGAASANQSGIGNVTLAVNNDIVAGTQISIGSTPGGSGNTAGTSTLIFGSGINNIATRTFTAGGDKSRATVTVAAGGTVNLNGFGTNTMDLLVGNYLNTGTAGITNTFDMTGGTLNASLNALTIGQKTAGNAGSVTGIFTVGAASNVISANSVTVSRLDGNNTAGTTSTAGTLNFGGGTFTVNNDVALATFTNNTVGTFTSTGTLNITGGTMIVGGNITRTTSDELRSNSFINVDGGALDLQSQATGDATAGTITASQLALRAGTITDVAGATLTATSSTNSGVAGTVGDALIVRDTVINFPVSITGATAGNVHYEAAGGGTGGTIAAVNLGSVGRTFNVENSPAAVADLTVSGAITGAVTLSKTGNGTLLLDGPVEGGVSVTAGAVGGNGTVAGPVNVLTGASLTPGNGLGTLGTGALTLAANTTITLEINSTLKTTDRVNVTGNLSLDSGNTVVLSISDLNAAPAPGLLTFVTYTGTWNGGLFTVGGNVIDDFDATTNPLSASFLIGGNSYQIDYNAGGNSIVLVTIPEPSAFAALAGGIGALMGLRRFRRLKPGR